MSSSARVTPTWELVDDPPANGEVNMATDRRLLDEFVAGQRPPTLRFYGWDPPCISLGLGQREDILDLELVSRAGVDVTRRPTGGQALLHDDELTYSVVASQADPAVGGTLMQSYHAISLALLSGLAELGVVGVGAPCEPRPAAGLTPVCFASASAEEVLVDGRKLLASAQYRSRGAFLQHGSLLLTDRQADLTQFFRSPTARALRPLSVSLHELTAARVRRDALVGALRRGFESALGIRFAESV